MKTKKKIIGAFAGKFLPPHIGHIQEIENSAKLCDELWVVVADHKDNSKKLCEQSSIPYISQEKRVKWLKEHFKNNSKIKIVLMREDLFGQYPLSMDVWSKEFKKLTKNKVKMKFADETYRELNEKFFSECKFVCFDRTKINISSSLIRKEPEKYLNFIIPEAQPFFRNFITKKTVKI